MSGHAHGGRRCTLVERLHKLNDALQTQGRRLRDAIAQTVGSAVSEATRDGVRRLLDQLSPGPERNENKPVPRARSFEDERFRDDPFARDRLGDQRYEDEPLGWPEEQHDARAGGGFWRDRADDERGSAARKPETPTRSVGRLEYAVTTAVAAGTWWWRRQKVGAVVREAVQCAVREVLGSPELLRAALTHHEAVQVESAPAKPQRKPVHEVVVESCGRLCETVGVKLAAIWQVISAAWTCCAMLLVSVGDQLGRGIGASATRWRTACNRMTLWAGRVWRFRRTCALAVSVGLACGTVAYLSGPLVSAALCVVGGAGLTVSALILVPLGRLLLSGYTAEA